MKRIWISAWIVLAVGLACLAAEPIVIGHRGAAGYLPEETLQGYAFGYAAGADYLEPDLVMTNDAHFICLHDVYLEPTTDVEARYPDRHRSDGHWYAADFTLEEIRTLSVHERCGSNGEPVYPDRFPLGASRFAVPTFEEVIELVQGLNRSTGRDVGIYPELKRPAWHAAQGLPMERALLDVLDAYGYAGPSARVYIQCFESDCLKTLRGLGTELPLVQLVSGGWADARLWTERGLDEIATYADGIGPSKGIIESNPDYVDWAHARDLVVHPYTFRADDVPSRYASFEDELERFYATYGVDGVFTDFPDLARAVLDAREAVR